MVRDWPKIKPMDAHEAHQPVFTFRGVVEKDGQRLAVFDMQMGNKMNHVTRAADELTREVEQAREAVKNWSEHETKHGSESNKQHHANARANLSAFETALRSLAS